MAGGAEIVWWAGFPHGLEPRISAGGKNAGAEVRPLRAEPLREISLFYAERAIAGPKPAGAHEPHEDEEPLFAFQSGDLDAFETLFRRHQRAVFGWVLRMVRNPAAAEEIVVEAFWRIYRAHARFDPARGFEAWARRIATHAAVDYLRTKRPETELTPEMGAALPAPAGADPAIADELRRATAIAFAKLPATLRVAATLAVIEERPQKEIAEALGISVGAVKLRVFRALRLLRKELVRQGITP
jgi:RNA polymerase sigma factor (sigma-70 family)